MDKPTYREFKDNQENIDVRLIRAGGERFYVEGTPYRFKYVQAGIFVLITAAALLISYMISGTAAKTALDKYEYLDIIRKSLLYVSVYYAFVYFLFMIENPLRYLFAGFKRVSEDYHKSQDGVPARVKRPSYMDILIDSLFGNRIELNHKMRNFIYCPDGSVFEEKRFRVYYVVWIILIFIIAMSLMTANLYLYLKETDLPKHGIYLVFYVMITLAIIHTSVFFIFPAIRWRLGRFEKVDIEKIDKEEYRFRPVIDR